MSSTEIHADVTYRSESLLHGSRLYLSQTLGDSLSKWRREKSGSFLWFLFAFRHVFITSYRKNSSLSLFTKCKDCQWNQTYASKTLKCNGCTLISHASWKSTLIDFSFFFSLDQLLILLFLLHFYETVIYLPTSLTPGWFGLKGWGTGPLACDCGWTWGRGRFRMGCEEDEEEDEEEDDGWLEAGASSASSSSAGAGVVGGGSLCDTWTERQATQLAVFSQPLVQSFDSPSGHCLCQFTSHVDLIEGQAGGTSLQPGVSSYAQPVSAAALVDVNSSIRRVFADRCHWGSRNAEVERCKQRIIWLSFRH